MTVTIATTDMVANGAPTQPDRPATVAEAVAQFRPFRRRLPAGISAVLPWTSLGLGAVVEILLVVAGSGFDLMLATGAIAAALAARRTNSALSHFPRALAGLLDRGLLCARGAEGEAEARLVAFLAESDAWLNHRLALLFGLGGALVMAVLYWPFAIGTLGEWAEALVGDWRPWLSVLFYLVVYGLGFVAGYLLWRPVALASRLAAAGKVFDLDLSLDHPDGCGGVKPLGDLDLGLASILAGPGLFFGGWALALSAFEARNFVGLPVLAGPGNELKLLFAGLAAACVVLSLVGFFWPSWGVGRAMRRHRAQVQVRLGLLDRQIHELARGLLENAERLEPAEGRAQEEKLDFLRRVHTRNRRVPVWPFDARSLLILLALQLVPLAGLAAAVVTLIPVR